MESHGSAPTRRDVLLAGGAMAFTATPLGSIGRTAPMKKVPAFEALDAAPFALYAYLDQGTQVKLSRSGTKWSGGGVEVELSGESKVAIHLSASVPVNRIMIRWHRNCTAFTRLLGDHWERAYGDLAWRPLNPDHPMPWYFFADDGSSLHAFGVMVQPNAHCCWTADPEGINLWADVRSGGVPVELGARTLEVCTVVSKRVDETFDAMAGFCKLMCPTPRVPPHPVFGFNDWDFNYGNINRPLFIETAKVVSHCSPNGVRPYAVVDAGWSPGGTDSRPYDRGNDHFGSMVAFADDVRNAGARPGLWYRALIGGEGADATWSQSRDKGVLDPTIPAVIDLIHTDVARFKKWGFELVKHDFSTFDMTGQWGISMGASITRSGWSFSDRSHTNAEITLNLYRTMRDAAEDMVLIGCNTYSHLSAGIFELNRIGDDTSGREWERTRKMGVNCLAFRSIQNRTFYHCDPDMAPITADLPWPLAKSYMLAVARSGQALFVSPELKHVGDEQRAAMREAFALAAKPDTHAVPLDWASDVTPRVWKGTTGEETYQWMDEAGGWPFPD